MWLCPAAYTTQSAHEPDWRQNILSHPQQDCVLVTGGAGFIGSNFVIHAVSTGLAVVNLDKLTYAGNPENLASLDGNPL